MEKRLQSIELNISSLQRQLSALQAQLADAEDDETRQQIQSQINMVTEQLNSLYHEQSDWNIRYKVQKSKRKLSVKSK